MYEAKLIIRGQTVAARDGATFDRLQPITEEVATQAASASREDALEAANSAAAAFPQWSQTPPDQRADILNGAAELIRKREPEFIDVVASETGGSESWARFNCVLAADIFRHAAGLTGYARETEHAGRDANVRSILVRQPVGVVLGLAPWNAPIVLGSRAVAAPLACGNTVVLKASELCPKIHSMIVEVLEEAGLPAGAANLVTNAPESATEVVEALIGHNAVRRVNFTGSTRVGKMVAETCARYLKPAVLELSGKAPLIVLEDADIDEAVKAAAFGAFFNQGQICISTERVIVDRSVADTFVEKLTAKAESLNAGDPRQGKFPLGSMISANAAARVRELVEDAISKEAALLAGGTITNTIMQPTVVDHVDSSMRIYREESFGPVAAVIRVSGEDEAISIANDTAYGLAASVFSRDIDRARSLAMRLESGICAINGPTVYDDPAMPFGGMKDSGYGRLGGEESVREFTELRWLAIHDNPKEYPI
ncbi:aldehyde dehydrogenase [Hoeflea sp.]|uniref:aldehyde dehydrogenase n=1 Tax=Hoeflea sp. TaxID=1940281 RepID=UPI003B025DAD